MSDQPTPPARPDAPPPQPPAPATPSAPPPSLHRFVPALLFAACAIVLVAAAVFVLSLDGPVTRRHDPRTKNAYVGGDVTAISARVTGYLTLLPIRDNQVVHAGDLIGVIDDADYRAQRDQAQAGLQAAQARLAAITAQKQELQAEIGQSQSAEAASEAAIVRTGPELARQRILVHTDVGERRALDQAVADQQRMVAGVAVAQARLRARQMQVAILEAQRRAAEAAVAARRADLALAQLNLGWTRIVAPIDGTLSARAVRVGDLLTPGAVLVSETPLDTVWVDADFIERQLPNIRVGQRAVLRIDAYPGERLDARVVGMSPVSGGALGAVPPDNTTGNFTKVAARVPVRIGIVWGNSRLRGLLRPGMSAVATILTDRDG